MHAFHIFTLAIAIFLSVDALPYDKPNVHTIPLKLKSITRHRLSRRAIGSMPVDQKQPDFAYFGQITFGTGTPQNFDIQFDTGSGDLFVFGKDCDSPACDGKPKYDSDLDTSFSPINEKDFLIKYDDGIKVDGDSAKTTIVIAGISVEAQEFGVVDEIFGNNKFEPYVGIIGMAFSEQSKNEQTTPITNLINNNQLNNPQFSFMLGRDADQSPSELTIGGSNPDRYHADTLTFTHLVDNNNGEWKIPIDNCIVNGEELNLEGRTGIIDTGTTIIILPRDDADTFYSKIINAKVNNDGSYSLPCKEHEISLVFGGKTWSIDYRDFIVEIDEDDCIGSVIYDNTGSDTEWVIGSAFLKNVYTIFDQGNRQVGFAELA